MARLSIGLTGGIGSGKSTAAAMLVAEGATLVDTDAIARALTAPGGAAMAPLVARFGAHIVGADGALDREAMRRLAFADPAVKRRLEAVLHPLIGDQAQREALAARSDVVVFDVPLLAESAHWRARVDRVLVIDCSESTQIERVLRRAGWSREVVERVIAQQAPRAARRAIADAVIHNEGGMALDTLAHAVRRLLTRWRRDPVEQ
jgi:dephospho-CoA kinase